MCLKVWTVVAEYVSDPPFVVRGLRPGTEYVFLVRARNSHGFGTPSPVSQPVTTRGKDTHRVISSAQYTNVSKVTSKMMEYLAKSKTFHYWYHIIRQNCTFSF